jgi:hypothetical protein
MGPAALFFPAVGGQLQPAILPGRRVPSATLLRPTWRSATMRSRMARHLRVGASLRLVAVLLILAAAAPVATAQQSHRPLPQPVLAAAPGLRPLGKGRHTLWGIRVYDATLWSVGPRWSASSPHALDIEPGRAVPADTLVQRAVVEMRDLKVGDENKLRLWQAEMTKVIPNVKSGDQVVIFCTDATRTLVYLNASTTGEVDDPSFCPAVMAVWLHPQTKHQALRKSLLGQ